MGLMVSIQGKETEKKEEDRAVSIPSFGYWWSFLDSRLPSWRGREPWTRWR